MADIETHKPTDKSADKPAAAHDLLLDHEGSKPAATEKKDEKHESAENHHESAENHHDGCADNLAKAVPLQEQLKFLANKPESQDKPQSPAEKLMLGLSPLDLGKLNQGDQNLEANTARPVALLDPKYRFDALDKTPGMSGFINASLEQKPTHLFSGTFENAQFADPFAADRTRKVCDFSDFAGLPHQGIFDNSQIRNMDFNIGAPGASEWSDFKLITSGALMLGGDNVRSNANPESKTDNVSLGSGAMNLFFKNASTDLKTADNSSWMDRAFASAENFGSKLIDGAKELVAGTSSASIDFSGLLGGNREVHDAPGGRVETFVDATHKEFKTEHDLIIQSRDADGKPHKVDITTDTGVNLKQDSNGLRTVKSNNSDISVIHDPKTGKVDAVDKTGAKIAEFNSAGDAVRYLQTADKIVVQPGQTLDQAYDAFKKEPSNAERLKTHPVILMDGKGESMTVQPDGSRIYTHPNGDSNSIYKHIGPDGKERDIKVNITKDAAGNELFSIDGENGKKLQINSDEAKQMMLNSRLKLDEHGQLMVNNNFGADKRREYWQHMIEQHRLNVAEGASIDLRNNTVTIDDSKNHTVTTVDKTRGTVTESDFNRHPDGTVDERAARILTVGADGKSSIQGMNAETGEPKAGDLITFDSKKGTVNAFDVEMTRTTADILHPGGGRTSVDLRGDVHVTDSQNRDILRTSGDRVSYDGGRTYEHYNSKGQSYTEAQAQKASADATAIASSVMAGAAALLGAMDLTAAQVDALASELSAAVGQCLSLGLPIPPQVAAAQASLSTLMAKVSDNNNVSSRLDTLAGQGGNKTLQAEAGSLTGSADERAKTTLKHHGYNPDEKNL